MAKLKAIHDDLIEAFINDERYTILGSGYVRRNGKFIGYTKATELKLRNKQYVYIKYQGCELKLHRIIYRKFIGNIHPKKVVHHIDGDGTNNNVGNLQLVTQAENVHFKYSG